MQLVVMDGPTDRPTDQQTDLATCRAAIAAKNRVLKLRTATPSKNEKEPAVL